LTSHSVSAPSHNTQDAAADILDTNKETINTVLSQFVRLSRPMSLVPGVKISPDALATVTGAQNTAAPWTWTVAEAYTTEFVLLPFLVHLAAAKNDLESLRYCIEIERQTTTNPMESPRIGITRSGNIAGGIINCLDAGSGRSPLHVSALNGHVEVVTLLLQSGALVHMRDTLGHTAIYYVCLSV
jgi:lysophospholipase